MLPYTIIKQFNFFVHICLSFYTWNRRTSVLFEQESGQDNTYRVIQPIEYKN